MFGSNIHPESPFRDRRVCPECAALLGVYEPLVYLAAGDPETTSLASQPWLEEFGGDLFHPACYSRRDALPDAPEVHCG
jgi:hypothetical protein